MMAVRWREIRSRAVVTLLAAFLVVGCSPTVVAPSQPAVCDGVPADMGGCSSARPVFAGSTCRELAEEWGSHVDRQVLAVIDGPPEADGKQRSVRISDALVLSSIVAGMRLDQLGLLADCDVPEFVPAAKAQFSDELRAGIGSALFDGNPMATEQDWEDALVRAIRIIDEGE
jgi:hypothetical protein